MCKSWFPLLSKNPKHKLQRARNKRIRFSLDLPPHSHMCVTQLRKIIILHIATTVFELPTLTHFAWFLHISLYTHALTSFFPNVMQFNISFSYPSIIHVILFHRAQGYVSMRNNITVILFRDYFPIKNVGSVHYWHPGKGATSNITPSKTQNFPDRWSIQTCQDFAIHLC